MNHKIFVELDAQFTELGVTAAGPSVVTDELDAWTVPTGGTGRRCWFCMCVRDLDA